MTFSPLNYLFNPQRRFCGHKIQSSLPTPATQPIVDTQDPSAPPQVLPLHQQSQGENLTAPQDLDNCPQSPQPAQMPQTAEINLQRQCLTLNFVSVLKLQYGFGKGWGNIQWKQNCLRIAFKNPTVFILFQVKCQKLHAPCLQNSRRYKVKEGSQNSLSHTSACLHIKQFFHRKIKEKQYSSVLWSPLEILHRKSSVFSYELR